MASVTKVGFWAAAVSLAWTLFVWFSSFGLPQFFYQYASSNGGMLWLRMLWVAVTVFGCIMPLYGTVRTPSKLSLIGLLLSLLSIALTIFVVSPLLWLA